MAAELLSADVSVVYVVDVARQIMAVYPADESPRRVERDERLTFDGVFPAFFRMRDLFE